MKELSTGAMPPTPGLDALMTMLQQIKSDIKTLETQHSELYDIALRYCSQREYLMSRFDEHHGAGSAEKILRNGEELVRAQFTAIENKYFAPENGHGLL